MFNDVRLCKPFPSIFITEMGPSRTNHLGLSWSRRSIRMLTVRSVVMNRNLRLGYGIYHTTKPKLMMELQRWRVKTKAMGIRVKARWPWYHQFAVARARRFHTILTQIRLGSRSQHPPHNLRLFRVGCMPFDRCFPGRLRNVIESDIIKHKWDEMGQLAGSATVQKL